MSEKTSWWRSWEITIDSDWITTVLMAFLFIICSAFLISEIRRFASGSVTITVPHSNQLLTNAVNIMIPVCFFMGAFMGTFESRVAIQARIAFLLMGIDFVSRLALGYFQASTRLQHFIGTAGSALRQIALTLALIAILKWFKSVVRWTPRNHMGES